MEFAETFAALHRPGEPLLLPNAWDAASAAVIAAAGAKAIATTSAGVAWALGAADAADLGAERQAGAVERIVAAVRVPVTADVEDGYGAVEETVTAVVRAGAVGINLEDRAGPKALVEPAEQAARVAAARAAAERLGVRLWINARTDVFLRGSGRVEEALERARVYADAGADSLFVPGLVDLGRLAEVVRGPLPVAVMVWAGAPSVKELAEVGVARISLGSGIAQAAYGLAARAAAEMLNQGTYDVTAGGLAWDQLNATVTGS